MIPKIVGFHGPYGSGKDTLGSALAETIPNSIISKFALPLYRMAAVIDPAFHITMTHAAKQEFVLNREELGTRRNFLEKLGTDFGREMIHPDFWVTILAKYYEDVKAEYPFTTMIITDVRAENEAAWIRRNDGIVFKLRPDWLINSNLETGHKITNELAEDDRDAVLYLKEGKIKEAVDAIHARLLRQ